MVADYDTHDSTTGGAGKRRLVSAFVVAAMLFAIVNFVTVINYVPAKRHLDQAAVNPANVDHPVQKQTKTWSYWVAKGYMEQTQAPDVVVFGSSQMGSAIACADAQLTKQVVDTATHKRLVSLETELQTQLGGRKPISVFNAAIPGCMVSDVDLISKVLFNESGLKPKVVVVGVAPRDFLDNTLPSPTGTEPWHFFAQFVPVAERPAAAFTDFFAALDWQINQHTLRELYPLAQVWLGTENANEPEAETDTKGKDKKNDTPLAAVLGTLGEVKQGQWLVPANIPPMWKDNTPEYKNRFKDSRHPIYKTEKQFFNDFLARMKQENIKVVAVGMPSLPMNRALLPDKFWARFHNDVGSACRAHGALYVPLYDDPSYQVADYLDTVHLDASGGQKLFARVAAAMAAQNDVKVALEQPDRHAGQFADTNRSSSQ